MKYPEKERVLVVRPCHKAICLNIRPAAKLLSLLLYYARNCDEQTADFTFSCTQQEIIDGLIDEIDVKTLHRTAIPMLRLLGFLDVDGSSYRYTYTVHLDLIQHCILHSTQKEQLDKILIVSMKEQLDKCLIQIDKCPIELVKCPIEFDKLLIPFRQMSNSKRGRKPRPQADLEAVSENDRLLQILQSDSENTESIADDPPTSPIASALSLDAAHSLQENDDDLEDQQATLKVLQDADIVPPPPEIGDSHASPVHHHRHTSGDVLSDAAPAENTAQAEIPQLVAAPTQDDKQNRRNPGLPTRTSAAVGDVAASEEVPPPSPPTRKRGSRKPAAPKIDQEQQKRIESVYSSFDALMQKVSGNSEAVYARTKAATDAIIELLTCNPTEERLKRLYLKLWKEPRGRNGFKWSEHMTIPNVCKQYDSDPLMFSANGRAPVAEETTSNIYGNLKPFDVSLYA